METEELERLYRSYINNEICGDIQKSLAGKVHQALRQTEDYSPKIWKPSWAPKEVRPVAYECIEPVEFTTLLTKLWGEHSETNKWTNDRINFWRALYENPRNKIWIGDIIGIHWHWNRECILTHIPRSELQIEVLYLGPEGKEVHAKDHFIPLFDQDLVNKRVANYVFDEAKSSITNYYENW